MWESPNDDNWYQHRFRDQRGKRPCRAYKWDEVPAFKHWLRTSYIPEHLPAYLITKYGKASTRLIYTENGLLNDAILSLTEVKRKAPADDKKFQDFLAARRVLELPESAT